jgi:putative component of membrane protein insertase Oxa1/YidC/SpoIIIJ protein YidD
MGDAKTMSGGLAVRVLVGLIKAYQRTVSPDHGWLRRWRREPFCGHTPTCSDYGIEALYRHGFRLGIRLTATRLRMCGRGLQPVDHVPDLPLAMIRLMQNRPRT